MPVREVVFANDQVYHLYNRGVNHQPIFNHHRDYQRALRTVTFYPYHPLLMSLSHFLRLNSEEKEKIYPLLKKKDKKIVDVFSFCLMPNHFHFLLKQKKKDGISRFLSNFQNSYTRYFNRRHQRSGHLFQGQFKAVWIETDEQLIHVSRYIHLNPYSSFLVKDFEALKDYPWSSLGEYLNLFDHKICEKETLFSFFPTIKKLEKFIFDQKDYQRELESIKHLVLEKVYENPEVC